VRSAQREGPFPRGFAEHMLQQAMRPHRHEVEINVSSRFFNRRDEHGHAIALDMWTIPIAVSTPLAL